MKNGTEEKTQNPEEREKGGSHGNQMMAEEADNGATLGSCAPEEKRANVQEKIKYII